jgi:hypothetical protein
VRHAFAISIAVFLLGAVAPTAPVPAERKQPTLFYYPTEGSVVWTYDTPDGEEKLAIDGFKDAEDVRVGTLEIFTRNPGGRMVHDEIVVSRRGLVSAQFAAEEPRVLLPVPFRVGETWEYANDRIKSCSKVLRTERLKVPAGTYETVCVETSSAEPGKHPTCVSVWYAPGVGMVKKTDDKGTWVLKEFWQQK